ncbi:dihydrodipicolinate synthase family protein [Nakamurella lactea]|uniref:dihydrodipicolinate synthase family protein n=1 Tax=Nakamurella lactea TaxID=459515 RepID=UPI00048EEA59
MPPVCTPFNEDLTVDVESLRRLVDHLIAGGVSGLFALGSSSEVVFLTRDQRRVVLQTVVDQAAGRVPILAGVIDTTTPRVLEHVADARAIGADGYVLTAPFYTRTHPNEIEQHFRLVKESVGDRPLFAYDLPISVQVKLATGFVLDLAEQGVLAGVKDSSGSDHSIRALVTGRDDRGLQGFSVLTGSEVTVDSAIGYGADGAVPGLGNVDPAGYTALVAKAAAGDAAGARHEQERLIRLFDIVNQGDLSRMGGGSAGIGSFKAALTLLGIFARPLMAPPQIQLNDTELEGVRRCLAGAGLI